MTHDHEAEARADWADSRRDALEDAAMVAAWEAMQRPPEPQGQVLVWYRGWECGFNYDAASWTGEGWRACLGGADLDCIQVSARTWGGLLDEIDDHDMSGAAA